MKSPSFPLNIEGIGTRMRVPVGIPVSSTSTMLLLSKRGTNGFCFCLTPTMYAFFFWPLIATRTLSPRVPTPFLLYTWIHLAGRPLIAAARPMALLSTTCNRVSLMMCCRRELTLQTGRQRWLVPLYMIIVSLVVAATDS